MIAKVRIAPMEQWCESAAPLEHRNELAPLVGAPILIITDEVVTDGLNPAGNSLCGGRWWKLHESSVKELQRLIGGHELGDMFCEHMLEMD